MLKRITTTPRQLARAGLLSAALGLAQVALAGPIGFGTFYQFGFDTAGGAVSGCQPADPAGLFCISSSGTPTEFLDAPAWTFVAGAAGAALTVIDAFTAGDEFDIFDFGVRIGSTSAASGNLLPDCGDDPVACLATVGMSTGVFNFAAGAHSLTLVSTRLANDFGGSAYLRVVDAGAVPEPGSTALVLGAMGVLVGLRRRSPIALVSAPLQGSVA